MNMNNYDHTHLNRAWATVDLTDEKAWHYGHDKELTEKTAKYLNNLPSQMI